MGAFIDLSGQRFGKLTVVGQAKTQNQKVRWLCKCDCGGQIEVITASLRNGNTTSCGCLHRSQLAERNRLTAKHGFSDKERLYRIWHAMRQRCNDPRRKDYPRYGGRGITVCSEWNDYLCFREWALSNGYADDLSIDRIDFNGGYSPENCRWADSKLQAQNRSKTNIRRDTNGTYKRAN